MPLNIKAKGETVIFNKLNHKQKGFSLLELLVVIALLGILAAVAIPNVLRYIGESERTAALEEQHNILIAVSAALNFSNASPRVIYQEYIDVKIPSIPGTPNFNDPARYLNKTTQFNWNISDTGVLSPGTDNPLKG